MCERERRANGGRRKDVEEDRDGGWQRVKRKNTKIKHVNIYVANLPSQCSSKILWEHFSHMKNMVDAFIPNKKDGRGNTFGFLRFKQVMDEEELLRNISSTWVEGRRLYANISKYDRDSRPSGGKQWEKKSQPESQPQFIKKKIENPRARSPNLDNRQTKWRDKRSYADIAKGNFSNNTPKQNYPIFEVSNYSKKWGDLKGKSFLAKAKDLNGVNNIKKLMGGVYVEKSNIRYIGGLHILISFDSKEMAEQFDKEDKNKLLEQYESISVWKGEWPEYERIAWINITGIPIQVWGKEVANAIGNRFGRVVFESEDEYWDKDLSYDRVAILVRHIEKINTKFIIKMENKMVEGWVLEDSGFWIPDCINPNVSGDSRQSSLRSEAHWKSFSSDVQEEERSNDIPMEEEKYHEEHQSFNNERGPQMEKRNVSDNREHGETDKSHKSSREDHCFTFSHKVEDQGPNMVKKKARDPMQKLLKHCPRTHAKGISNSSFNRPFNKKRKVMVSESKENGDDPFNLDELISRMGFKPVLKRKKRKQVGDDVEVVISSNKRFKSFPSSSDSAFSSFEQNLDAESSTSTTVNVEETQEVSETIEFARSVGVDLERCNEQVIKLVREEGETNGF